MTTPATALAPPDLAFVRQLVRERSAIVLDGGKDYLIEARLGPLARHHGMASTSALIAKTRSEPLTGPLHEAIVQAMTTNETSWFRDVDPFRALEQVILPDLIRKRSATRALNIWSAACSSGQEPYTIAMVIRDRFPQLNAWNIRIIASDLSAEMLGRAAAGRYSQIEVNRGLPAPMLVKYFARQGTEWQIRDDLRQMVEFRALNLVKPWSFLPAFDLVFLRNVLIYFDVEAKRSVLSRTHAQMRPDGVLFLGTAETTLNLDVPFERVPFGRASYYVRTA